MTQCLLQSGGEADTALSDGSQCGIGIRASDHVVTHVRPPSSEPSMEALELWSFIDKWYQGNRKGLRPHAR